MNFTAFFAGELLAQMHSYDWGPGMSGWGFHSGWLWQPIIMGIIVVLIILGVVSLVRWKGASVKEETPLDILKKRYARGEIGKDEFEEKKMDLGA